MVVHPGHAGCCAGFGDGVVDFLDREPRAVALNYPAQVIPRAFARCRRRDARRRRGGHQVIQRESVKLPAQRSEEHTSELQSLMRISYAVFCLKKKTTLTTYLTSHKTHHTSV